MGFAEVNPTWLGVGLGALLLANRYRARGTGSGTGGGSTNNPPGNQIPSPPAGFPTWARELVDKITSGEITLDQVLAVLEKKPEAAAAVVGYVLSIIRLCWVGKIGNQNVRAKLSGSGFALTLSGPGGKVPSTAALFWLHQTAAGFRLIGFSRGMPELAGGVYCGPVTFWRFQQPPLELGGGYGVVGFPPGSRQRIGGNTAGGYHIPYDMIDAGVFSDPVLGSTLFQDYSTALDVHRRYYKKRINVTIPRGEVRKPLLYRPLGSSVPLFFQDAMKQNWPFAVWQVYSSFPVVVELGL